MPKNKLRPLTRTTPPHSIALNTPSRFARGIAWPSVMVVPKSQRPPPPRQRAGTRSRSGGARRGATQTISAAKGRWVNTWLWISCKLTLQEIHSPGEHKHVLMHTDTWSVAFQLDRPTSIETDMSTSTVQKLRIVNYIQNSSYAPVP